MKKKAKKKSKSVTVKAGQVAKLVVDGEHTGPYYVVSIKDGTAILQGKDKFTAPANDLVI